MSTTTPECYIRDYGTDWVPARILRETKSTIIVTNAARLDDLYPITFQTRKVWGEDRYYDPRLENSSIGINPLLERGNTRYGKRLTFECDKVLKDLEETRRDKVDTALSDLKKTLLDERANLPMDVPAPVFVALEALMDAITQAKATP